MDSAINGLAKTIVEGLPECWGDQVVEGQIIINLTINADIMDELIEEVQHLDAPRCRICGCTDDSACFGGCYWVADDICSRCFELIFAKVFPDAAQLIVLPVPIGSPIYAIYDFKETDGTRDVGIEELHLSGYIKEGEREFYTTYDELGDDLGACDIDVKDAFATREAAEAELSRRQLGVR